MALKSPEGEKKSEAVASEPVKTAAPLSLDLLKATDIDDLLIDFKILIAQFAYFIRAHKKWESKKKIKLYITRKHYFEVETFEITAEGMESEVKLWEQKDKKTRKPLNLVDLMNESLKIHLGYFHILFAEYITFLYRYVELVFQINIDKTKLKDFDRQLLNRITDFFKTLNVDFPFMFLPLEYEPQRYLPQIPTPEGFEVRLPPADPPEIPPPPFKEPPISAIY